MDYKVHCKYASGSTLTTYVPHDASISQFICYLSNISSDIVVNFTIEIFESEDEKEVFSYETENEEG